MKDIDFLSIHKQHTSSVMKFLFLCLRLMNSYQKELLHLNFILNLY